ncbi:bifunctional adenosylcobinamide kinase/adenosylcobinamide-phosphate guanylyltransferase [Paenibacillus sp. A14]|uniref:bifunctional adenosylcobinamide kinase/adenosylcobinamide-phosphate guanylyltransferase n=1 Tax=Paenibacillus sp. A14 TaxID=3119820 RepID=UPI002FE18B52
MIVTVTGGARSGKSSFAERWCMKHAPSGWYVATAQAFDEEMRLRIGRHRLQREDSRYPWTTLEEPLRLAGLLKELPERAGFSTDACVLVDCLTLWLSNILLAAEAEGRSTETALLTEISRLREAVAGFPGTIVLVTNEVGSGIVPEYPLGRLYRDYAGMLNQRMAEISDQVFWVTAGIPIELKSREYLL